jgi:hypothetical protein
MAEIKEDGVYTIKGQEKDVSIQYRKGTVVPDDVEFVRVGDFTEPPADTTRERVEAQQEEAAKADAAPTTKAAPAPDNKKANG